MSALFADAPLRILEGVLLFAIALGLLLASVAHTRSFRPGNRVAQLFWRDVSQAGYIWAGATVVTLAGALLGVEGIRLPIWLALELLVGLALLAAVHRRWRRQGLVPGRTRVDDPSRPDRSRLISRTWEIGLLGAGAGGFVAYAASMSHGWGHPIHWLVAGLGLAIGYAAGLIVGTPRYTVTRGPS